MGAIELLAGGAVRVHATAAHRPAPQGSLPCTPPVHHPTIHLHTHVHAPYPLPCASTLLGEPTCRPASPCPTCEQLESLPEALGGLTALRILGLKSNRLTALPASISGLQRLVELFITDNLLTDLPQGACGRVGCVVGGAGCVVGSAWWAPERARVRGGGCVSLVGAPMCLCMCACGSWTAWCPTQHGWCGVWERNSGGQGRVVAGCSRAPGTRLRLQSTLLWPAAPSPTTPVSSSLFPPPNLNPPRFLPADLPGQAPGILQPLHLLPGRPAAPAQPRALPPRGL